MNAFTISPRNSSGAPITAASLTAGWPIGGFVNQRRPIAIGLGPPVAHVNADVVARLL